MCPEMHLTGQKKKTKPIWWNGRDLPPITQRLWVRAGGGRYARVCRRDKLGRPWKAVSTLINCYEFFLVATIPGRPGRTRSNPEFAKYPQNGFMKQQTRAWPHATKPSEDLEQEANYEYTRERQHHWKMWHVLKRTSWPTSPVLNTTLPSNPDKK
eukprot:961711-Amphidinium_carterae.2